jgi:hypothetical protein
MNRSEFSQKADALFNRGNKLNCAQTVLLVMTEYFARRDRLADLAAPFGGGLCGTHTSSAGPSAAG